MDEHLDRIGLTEYEEVWLTSEDSCNFPDLFDSLFYIATHPHTRRIKGILLTSYIYLIFDGFFFAFFLLFVLFFFLFFVQMPWMFFLKKTE